ncbi:SPJ_0845 family protein [Lacticaseibacillus sharpeae]|uniref:Uncharacterized protein n=1 Tax=Lacticaseibacillus sharpeae JCM 1186 = DSM 20505 TaxID=1291052 RepID=A0A0R1ZNB5_9LACO|nr:SPJ_0845 family protein [Lacticaseibacillus sharpeae]KRM55962.1 hypothetical protein FC18_GL000743 [Lacticaseibacillus sharpeae JCM 1186 = DSM 20505]
MGLKVNRQTDMDKLFDQFASLPDDKNKKLEVDPRKKEREAERDAAYARLKKNTDTKK